MNKLIKIIFLTAILSISAFAQTNGDDYKRNEFFVGFSNQQVENFDRDSYNGFEGSYVRNVRRYVGIKGDFSVAFRRDRFNGSIPDPITGATVATFNLKSNNSIYNFLGGVQIKDNSSKARFKPFAHALAGVAHFRNKNRVTCTSGNCPAAFTPDSYTFSDTGFSTAFGGGLDIKINDKIDFRAIQADYNPIRANGQWSNNFRFGIGVVFK